MRVQQLVFPLGFLLGFLFVFPVRLVFAAEPYFAFPDSGLGDKVIKEPIKEMAKDLWVQEIFVKNFPGDKVADWYKTDGEKAGWKVESKQRGGYNIVQHITKEDLFFETEIQWGIAVREDPEGRREEDSSITVEWGPKVAFENYYGFFPLLYPQAEPVGKIKEITSPFVGQEQKFKTKMGTTIIPEWYEKKLDKVGWQTEGLKMERFHWSQTFTRGEEKLMVSTGDMAADPMVFTLSWNKTLPWEEKEISPGDLTSTQDQDLKDLMSNYYYFRHLANQRMGWHFWDWALSAVFPEQMEAIKGMKKSPLDRLVDLVGLGDLKERWDETTELFTNLAEMVARKDTKAAKCLLGSYAGEKAEIIGPVNALLWGGFYTDCMIDRAKFYYQKTLEKLTAEDPSYCVFKETWEGKDYCYKTWFEYWQEFRPKGAFSMLTAVPRSLEEYNKAALRWQEKTKFGEFSDGTKYTVKEIAGEEWQDAFEDMNWTTQRYEIPLFEGEKTEVAPLPSPPTSRKEKPKGKPKVSGEEKNVALQSNGGRATADSFGSYAGVKATAEKGNDGDKNNFWGGTNTPGWYQVEFDKTYPISKIVIYTYYHTQTFNIELSRDGSDWTKVVSETRTKNKKPSGEGENDKKTFEITPTEAKYIKVNILDSDAPGSHIWQEAIIELEAYSFSEGREIPETETGKITTVAEFNNLPNPGGFYGCGFSESDPAKPITMELEITRRVEEKMAENFITSYRESGEDLPLYAACPLYTYEGRDSTGAIELCVLHCDREYGQCGLPTKKLEVGKKYLLIGCRPYVGTGGPGPGPSILGVRDDWENAIVEK